MQLPPDIQLVGTADGSPTLAIRRADGYVEPMHHSKGAYGESVYIYGEALERARARRTPVRVVSVGLGLAYNELLTLARLGDEPCTIWSFETVPYLRDEFTAWAGGRDDGALAPSYDYIAARLGAPGVRTRAARALERGDLHLLGSFPEDTDRVVDANLVYFDAFSSKMDPGLWDEEVLVAAFRDCLAPACWLATYAVTGSLKRALDRLQFTRLRRHGFSYRRQSTLAVRGLPPEESC